MCLQPRKQIGKRGRACLGGVARGTQAPAPGTWVRRAAPGGGRRRCGLAPRSARLLPLPAQLQAPLSLSRRPSARRRRRQDARPGPRAERPGAAGLPAVQHAAGHQDVRGGRHHRPGAAAEEGLREPGGRAAARRPPVLPGGPGRGALPESPPQRHGDHLPVPVPGPGLLLPAAQPHSGAAALPAGLPGPHGAHGGLPGQAARAHPLAGLHAGPAALRLHGPADHLGGGPPPVSARPSLRAAPARCPPAPGRTGSQASLRGGTGPGPGFLAACRAWAPGPAAWVCPPDAWAKWPLGTVRRWLSRSIDSCSAAQPLNL